MVCDDNELIDKVESLLLADDETDALGIAQSFGVETAAVPTPPTLGEEAIALYKGYLRASFTAGGEGEELALAWTRLLSSLLPDATVHAWGHEDGMWEFWCRGVAGATETRQDEPDSGDDADILTDIYPWWHEGMPPGVKTGLLQRRFKHPGRKPAARNSTRKKAAQQYKTLYDAWQARDYEYLDRKITNRNLYSSRTWEDARYPKLPLEFACKEKDARFVALLLARDYDFTQANKDGDSALHWACHYGDVEIIDMVLASGADPNTPGHRGDCPLNKLFNNRGLAEDEELEVLDKMLEAGLNVQYRNQSDNTLLWPTAVHSKLRVAEKLLELGIDINHRNKNGTTVAFACDYGGPKGEAALRFFLEKGANPSNKEFDNIMTRWSAPRKKKIIEWGFANEEDF